MTSKRPIVIALVAAFVVLLILSVVLPYVGGGHSGLTDLFH
jgi:type II secretory pathway component PulF